MPWRPFSVPRSDSKMWMDSPRFRAMCEALLESGHQVRFQVSGLSMQPNLREGDAVIVVRAEAADLRRGDIVLSEDNDGLRVHRLVSATGPEAQAALDAITELVASKFNEEGT